MIIDYKTQGEWEIQLTVSISFISSNDSDETGNLRIKSNNIEILMGNETDEIIEELCEPFLQKVSRRITRINEKRNQFYF